jgi:hypothetical protein
VNDAPRTNIATKINDGNWELRKNGTRRGSKDGYSGDACSSMSIERDIDTCIIKVIR